MKVRKNEKNIELEKTESNFFTWIWDLFNSVGSWFTKKNTKNERSNVPSQQRNMQNEGQNITNEKNIELEKTESNFFTWIWDLFNSVGSWFTKKNTKNERSNVPSQQRNMQNEEQNITNEVQNLRNMQNEGQIVYVPNNIFHSDVQTFELMVSEYIETGNINLKYKYVDLFKHGLYEENKLLVWHSDWNDNSRISAALVNNVFKYAAEFPESMGCSEVSKDERISKVWNWLNEQRKIIDECKDEMTLGLTEKTKEVWEKLDAPARNVILMDKHVNMKDFVLVVGDGFTSVKEPCRVIYSIKKDIEIISCLGRIYNKIEMKYCCKELRKHGILEAYTVEELKELERIYNINQIHNNNRMRIEDKNNALTQIYSCMLQEESFFDYGCLFQGYKLILDKTLLIKESFVNKVTEAEKFIRFNVIKGDYNILVNNSDIFKTLDENWKTVKDILYLIAFVNVLTDLINKELLLCDSQPEKILEKYFEFGSIDEIRLQLIKIMLLIAIKKIILEEFLTKNVSKDLKKRSIIGIIFMGIARAMKKLCLYIWNKMKWSFKFPPGPAATGSLLSMALLLLVAIVSYRNMNMETIVGSLEYFSNQILNNKCYNI